MINWINTLIGLHTSVLLLALIVLAYSKLRFVQKRIPYKQALYTFYALLFVGTIYSAVQPYMDQILSYTQRSSVLVNVVRDSAPLDRNVLVNTKASIISPLYLYALYSLLGAAIIGVLFFLVSVATTVSRLMPLTRVRSYGGVHVLKGDAGSMPYVFSLWNRSYVVIPSNLLAERRHLSNIVKHEFQHIRNKDTSCIFLISLLKSVLFLNPAAHSLCRSLRNLHELAVDSEIIRINPKNSQGYLQTLAWVFEQSFKITNPAPTNGFFGKNATQEFAMRINNIKDKGPYRVNVSAVLLLLGFGFLGISCVSRMSDKNLMVDSLSTQPDEARKLYRLSFRIQEPNEKPVSMNVVTRFNEEALMMTSKDPEWFKNMEKNEMKFEEDKLTDWTKISFRVTERGEGWVKIQIIGTINRGADRKNFELTSRYPLKSTNKIESINAEMVVDDFYEEARL